jgi:hypothetical protein
MLHNELDDNIHTEISPRARLPIPSIPTFVKSQRPYANVQDLFLQGEWMSSKENAITALGDGKLFVAEAVTNIVP